MILFCFALLNCKAMIVDINIRDYRNLYFQADGDESAWTEGTYHLVAQVQPYQDNAAVKDPYKNNWLDEDGDDEYTAQMFRKAFEFQVKFFVKAVAASDTTAMDEVVGQRNAFRDVLINAGSFKFYDDWNRCGFRSVRFVKDETEERHIKDGVAWMIFSVTFKVNDPNAVVLSGSSLIDA